MERDVREVIDRREHRLVFVVGGGAIDVATQLHTELSGRMSCVVGTEHGIEPGVMRSFMDQGVRGFDEARPAVGLLKRIAESPAALALTVSAGGAWVGLPAAVGSMIGILGVAAQVAKATDLARRVGSGELSLKDLLTDLVTDLPPGRAAVMVVTDPAAVTSVVDLVRTLSFDTPGAGPLLVLCPLPVDVRSPADALAGDDDTVAAAARLVEAGFGRWQGVPPIDAAEIQQARRGTSDAVAAMFAAVIRQGGTDRADELLVDLTRQGRIDSDGTAMTERGDRLAGVIRSKARIDLAAALPTAPPANIVVLDFLLGLGAGHVPRASTPTMCGTTAAIVAAEFYGTDVDVVEQLLDDLAEVSGLVDQVGRAGRRLDGPGRWRTYQLDRRHAGVARVGWDDLDWDAADRRQLEVMAGLRGASTGSVEYLYSLALASGHDKIRRNLAGVIAGRRLRTRREEDLRFLDTLMRDFLDHPPPDSAAIRPAATRLGDVLVAAIGEGWLTEALAPAVSLTQVRRTLRSQHDNCHDGKCDQFDAHACHGPSPCQVCDRELAIGLRRLGSVQHRLGELGEALEPLTEEVDLSRDLYQANDTPATRRDLALGLNGLGGVQESLGQLDEALETHTEQVDLSRRPFQASDTPTTRRDLLAGLNRLGSVQRRLGQLHEALKTHTEEVDLHRGLYQANDTPTTRRDLAIGLGQLGIVQQGLGQLDEALETHTEAVDLARGLYETSDAPATRRDLALGLGRLGSVQHDLGQLDEALTTFTEAVDLGRGLYETDDPPATRRELALALNDLAVVHEELGNMDRAQQLHEETSGLMPEPDDTTEGSSTGRS